MKSKSFELGHASDDNKLKQNRTFDFINLYKTAADTSTCRTEKHTLNETDPKIKERERSPHSQKKKDRREPVDISHLNIEGPHMNDAVGGNTPIDQIKATSTPKSNRKNQKSPKVKSIMKVSASPAITEEVPLLDISPKSKKRNKSVSFLLEDNEEVKIKKTKSDDFANVVKSKKHWKKLIKDQDEKENKVKINVQTMDVDKTNKKLKIKREKQKLKVAESPAESVAETYTDNDEGKKKKKHLKKAEKYEVLPEDSSETALNIGEKVKKPKKKKHQEKLTEIENKDSEEPAAKSPKKEEKPDVITDLENLSIGDNAHTLTNLLDGMKVVDKDKKKKLKQKLKNKKDKIKKQKDSPKKDEADKEGGIEKTKWKKKWNKKKKVEERDVNIDTTVIVENLPISLLCTYKKLLNEHFVKYGLIRTVGIAETYPTEESTPVFATTIHFYSDGAAVEALKEHKTIFEGSRIRVKPVLPPTDTTLVVRSYGPLTPQYISSEFNTAGRIRSIRHMGKGKNSIGTFFVEFDGKKALERAFTLGADIKVGGKKIHVSRFEPRAKKPKTNDNQADVGDLSDESS